MADYLTPRQRRLSGTKTAIENKSSYISPIARRTKANFGTTDVEVGQNIKSAQGQNVQEKIKSPLENLQSFKPKAASSQPAASSIFTNNMQAQSIGAKGTDIRTTPSDKINAKISDIGQRTAAKTLDVLGRVGNASVNVIKESGALKQLEYSNVNGKLYPKANIPFKVKRPSFYGKGNIDLNNRPTVKNKDGSISTVRSMSFGDENGKEILVPTVSMDGRIMSNQEAIDNYYKTGQFLGKFDSVDDANAEADKIHNSQEKMYNAPVPKDLGGAFVRGITGQDRPDPLEIAFSKETIQDLQKKAPLYTGAANFALGTLADPTTYIGGGAIKGILGKSAKVVSKADDVLKTESKVKNILDNEMADAALKGSKEISKFKQYADGSIVPQSTFDVVRKPVSYADGSVGEKVDYIKKPMLEFESAKPIQAKINDGNVNQPVIPKGVQDGIKDTTEGYIESNLQSATGDLPKVRKVTPFDGNLPRPAAKINLNTKKERKPLNLYTSIVDNQNPLNKLSKQTGGKEYELASNSRNVGGTVDYILKDALVDRQGNKIGESLQTVSRQIPKGKEEVFWEYMMQRNNIDRAFEDKPVYSNYTPEMSTEAVKIAEAANPEFKQIGNNITEWIDQFMRAWGVDAGTVDEVLYNQLRDTYKSYIPTNREFSQLEKSIPGGVSRKFVDQNSPIKKATGSDRDIANPIKSIMGLVDRTVKTSRYNDVGQELLRSVRDGRTNLAEIVPAQEGVFANTDNVVTVLEGGKPVYLRINDKNLLDALNGLPKTVNNVPGIRKITGAYKGLITQKNPIFAARNIARDLPTSYIYGSTMNPLKFGANYVGAVKDIATNSPRYQQYRAVGGGSSNFFRQGDTVANDLLKKPSPFRRVGNAIEKLNNATETAPRLAEFNRTLKKTGDVNKALFEANDVTVNFARGGNTTKAAEPFVPYLNASVQGLDKFFRTVKDPKKLAQMLVKGGISITAPTIGLYLVNKDNPNYQQLDNRTKDTYFLIPSGEKDQYGYEKTFIKIPKSREMGFLFGTLFERALRQKDGDKEAWKGIGGLRGTAATNFSPTNPFENNLFSPLYNLKANKDFAGRSIVSQGMLMDNRSPYLQYDERTTEPAKWAAEQAKKLGVDLSPKQLDYLVKSYTGIVGQVGQPLTTQGGNPTKIFSTSFVADPVYSNQTVQDFYDNYNLLQTAATDKNIVEQLPTNGKDNVVTDEEKLRNQFAKASEEISGINKQIRQLESSLMPDKESQIKALRQQITEIAKAANQLLQ